MPDVLVRNLDEADLERLKARAADQQRSLQAELRLILRRAAGQANCTDIQEQAAALRHKLEGRPHTDSARLVAEDRAR